jgi:hypothetical protein
MIHTSDFQGTHLQPFYGLEQWLLNARAEGRGLIQEMSKLLWWYREDGVIAKLASVSVHRDDYLVLKGIIASIIATAIHQCAQYGAVHLNEKYKQNNDKNAVSGNNYYEQNAIAYLGQLPNVNFDPHGPMLRE